MELIKAIAAKVLYGAQLADVDYLHGGADQLLVALVQPAAKVRVLGDYELQHAVGRGGHVAPPACLRSRLRPRM